MTLNEMYALNQKATKALFEKIKNIEGVTILEQNEGISFTYEGHTYYFISEFAE